MDVREKLIELQMQAKIGWTKGEFADYLIANGVTVQENVEISDELLKQLKNTPITICKEEPSIELVQEWISVDDRLPEAWKQVLIYSRHDFYESAVYIGVPGKWRVTWNHEMLEADSVTHWMPLPQTPKGE